MISSTMRAALCGITILLNVQIANAGSYCESKDANRDFCKNGEPRMTCFQNGYLVWQDTRLRITKRQFRALARLVFDGGVPSGYCPAQ